MQNVSADYLRLMNATDRVFETKLVIDDVGTFSEPDLVSVSTSIAMLQGDPLPGNAVASEIDVKIFLPPAEIPVMACLRPYIRAKGKAPKSTAVTITNETLSSQYASYASSKITFAAGSEATVANETLSFPVDATESLTSEWIPQGVYFIDTREQTANRDGLTVLSIHGFDAMLKAEQMYSSSAITGDAKDKQFVQEIATAIGVDVDDRTWDIMGSGYTIPLPLGYTMREILGYIAAPYIGCFIMSDEGKLRLVSLLDLPEDTLTSLLATENGDVILIGGDAILV